MVPLLECIAPDQLLKRTCNERLELSNSSADGRLEMTPFFPFRPGILTEESSIQRVSVQKVERLCEGLLEPLQANPEPEQSQKLSHGG